MRLKILIAFIFYVLTTIGQELPYIVTNGTFDKKSVLKQIRKEIRKAKKRESKASYTESVNGDTIVFFMKDNVEGLKVKYVFNIPSPGKSKIKYCGIQEYYFDCTPCASKHLSEIILNCSFRKFSPGKYLSNYFNQTELEVIKDDSGTDCLSLICRFVDKSKMEYQVLYDSLKEE